MEQRVADDGKKEETNPKKKKKNRDDISQRHPMRKADWPPGGLGVHCRLRGNCRRGGRPLWKKDTEDATVRM